MKLAFPAIGRKPALRDRGFATNLARVASALQPQKILLDIDVRGTEQALQLAADAIGHPHGLNPTLVFDALWRREQAASTALGGGFAIPHARLPGIERAATLFIRLRNAIPFGAADGLPVHHLLVILVPRDGADADHLRMLSLISQLLSRRGFAKKIDRATDASAVDVAFRSALSQLVLTARPDE